MDPDGNLTIYAGTGAYPSNITGDGGPATEAFLYGPLGVALDSSGNLYIADGKHCVIREVIASSGVIKTVAGSTCNPGNGYFYPIVGDGGPALSAEFAWPQGVFVDPAGNIFIADWLNCAVREVVAATGIIHTVAGNGSFPGYSGDGQQATQAQLPWPTSVFVDNNGNVFITDSGNNAIREVAANGIIQTIAGNGTAGYAGNGGPAINALLNSPNGLLLDSLGNIFFADTGNFVVREIIASSGIIQTVAGNGTQGYSGDSGPATSAELSSPAGVFVDESGDLFIPDGGNQVVREVVAATGDIETVAGNGKTNTCGDGFPAASACLSAPNIAFTDPVGNIFIADSGHSVIREVVAATGIIKTIAGNGVTGYSGDGGPPASAQLAAPEGVFVDNSGNIFIADSGNNVIRQVIASTGTIKTIAGTGIAGYSGDGGSARSAMLHYPSALFLDSSSNIFIADQGNRVIRKILAATGVIVTVAGDGTMGYSGDGGPATSAELGPTTGVFVDSSGNIFIADSNNNVVREVFADSGIIQTVAGNGQCGFSGDGGPATSASICLPSSVFLDAAGNMFIPNSVIPEVREVFASTDIIETVAGNRQSGYTGDGGPALSASLLQPAGVSQGPSASLLITDAWANVIRSVAGLLSSPWASLSATSLKFPDQIVGTAAPAQTLTIASSGTTAMSIGSVTLSSSNSKDFGESNSCAGKSLAPKETCAVTVTFTPSVAAAESASLTIVNSGNGPQILAITGAGIKSSLITSGSSTQTVKAGQTATYDLQLSVTGGAASTDQISAKITCTAAPAESTCSTPSTVVATPAKPANFQVTVQTTGSSASSVVPGTKTSTWLATPILSFYLLLPFVAAILTLPCGRLLPQPKPGKVILAVCLTSLLLWTALFVPACGSSTQSTASPTKTYTLTVNATIGSQTTSTQLTLVVQ
ncbi:MAG: choice-of-anchor D domain-containing protein [Candidatus Sulfotelmatobacter sp.]